ncbi:ABC transporter permease [SAR202 cluster bacterium AC-647-N09_OGT_505m]|nr:ABC transporter permease [SAR202 cluster bacterium AC-647-N09_OGT_505m]
MQRYIARRIALGMFTAALVTLLIFALLRIAPGDVAMMIATQDDPNAAITEADLDEIREQLGLNAPLPTQYVTWIRDVLTLDWGVSLYHGEGIWDTFKQKLPVTLELAIVSVALSTILGIPCGIIMALRQDTWLDYSLRIFSLAGLSIPNFWIATMLLVGGMYILNWNPRLQYESFLDDPGGNMSQFLWPSIIVGYSAMATKARMMRSTMLEVLRQDYIRTAHAKGLKHYSVVTRHALKNALLPVVTIVGLSIAGILGGSVIIERIFNLPGMGNMLVEAMNNRDYPVVQILVLIFAMWIVLVNLLVDLSYGWLDPRVRF